MKRIKRKHDAAILETQTETFEVNLKDLTDIVLSSKTMELYYNRPFNSKSMQALVFDTEKEARRVYSWLCEKWKE